MIGYTCSKIESMKNLRYFRADASKHKSRLYQVDFIGAYLQANVKHIVFVKLASTYGKISQNI